MTIGCEVIKDLLSSYIDELTSYMADSKKQGELFTHNKDNLTKDEVQNVKKMFAVAQKNESPMWQDVISFDNDWLEEQGIYNSKTKQLDEKKMKNVVREAVGKMLESEKMTESAIWTAAIHYNTKNIHVHLAITEPTPSREKIWIKNKDTNEWRQEYRGNRKQSSIEAMKSTVANKILGRTKQNERIDELIKGTRKSAIEENMKLASNKKIKRLFMKAITKMPDDLKQWRYGYASINEARPYIDEIVDVYLETYYKDELKELNELLDEEVKTNKRLYGDNSNHEQTKINKLYEGKDSLKYKMGNVVLTEMRNYVKEERKKSFRHNNQQPYRHNFRNWQQSNNLHFALIRLNASMRKTYYEYQKDRDIEEFDRMMNGYER